MTIYFFIFSYFFLKINRIDIMMFKQSSKNLYVVGNSDKLYFFNLK